MAQDSCNNPDSYLKQRGLVYIVDNCNARLEEVCKISNVVVSLDNEVISPETPDGCVLFKKADTTASISFDLYSAGNFPLLGKLFAGQVDSGYYDGTETVNNTVDITFDEENCCCLIPAAGATINTAIGADGVAYTEGPDFTTSVDDKTGYTFVCHVEGGAIDLGCQVTFDYSFSPTEGHYMSPNDVGIAKPFEMVVIVECDCFDDDKRIVYYLPDMLLEGSITQTLIEINSNNTDITPISLTATQQKDSGCSKGKKAVWMNACYIDPTADQNPVLGSITG